MSIINTLYHSWQSIVERVLGRIAYANVYELKIERDTLDMIPMRMNDPVSSRSAPTLPLGPFLEHLNIE